MPHSISWYVPGRVVAVAPGWNRGCRSYRLEAPAGADFAPDFRPEVTPARMLEMGVFEGKYLNDCQDEFPREWFEGSALRRVTVGAPPDPALNEFGVKSRLPLRQWRANGWIPAVGPAPGVQDCDPRGWFQWYCRYWLGRRSPEVDAVQIARWRSFARHRGQVLAAYRRLGIRPGDMPLDKKRAHRAKQRQALLQWAYDPYC